MSPGPIDRLLVRSQGLRRARSFFEARGMVEADVQASLTAPPIDRGVEVETTSSGYLHTSPEYTLKKYLALGSPDLYYLGHVFRKGDVGSRHSPEFTMAEWYRQRVSWDDFIEETCAFIDLFLPGKKRERIAYDDAFLAFVGFGPDDPRLVAWAKEHGYSSHPSLEIAEMFALSHAIEPQLGRKGVITILTDYPPHHAALAKLRDKGGKEVALRFELYVEGIELANGYYELADGAAIEERFHAENRRRIAEGKRPYPLDTSFLSIASSLPDCCGVSVGMDRLFLLQTNSIDINQVLWQ